MAVEVTAQQVKELRDATGAEGMATAAKKADRVAKEGIVQSYMHHTGRLGVLVEVNSETDFVARNDQFKKFAKELALHIASTAPRYVKREDIPQQELEAEQAKQREKTLNEGKKEAVVDKIVEGRMEKWYEEVVLLDQPWLHDDKLNVGEVLTQLIAEIKENLVIRRFARFALGEADGSEATESE